MNGALALIVFQTKQSEACQTTCLSVRLLGGNMDRASAILVVLSAGRMAKLNPAVPDCSCVLCARIICESKEPIMSCSLVIACHHTQVMSTSCGLFQKQQVQECSVQIY